jgi:hypothetical protein
LSHAAIYAAFCAVLGLDDALLVEDFERPVYCSSGSSSSSDQSCSSSSSDSFIVFTLARRGRSLLLLALGLKVSSGRSDSDEELEKFKNGDFELSHLYANLWCINLSYIKLETSTMNKNRTTYHNHINRTGNNAGCKHSPKCHRETQMTLPELMSFRMATMPSQLTSGMILFPKSQCHLIAMYLLRLRVNRAARFFPCRKARERS